MRNRSYRLEIVFLGIAASILIYQLLIPPIVGLANSGDFPRLMKIFGLSFTSNDVADIQYLFVNKHFYWDKSIHAGYPSSELYLALIVMAVIQFFTVTIGEGSHELMKHLFLFNLLCDVSFIFLILFAVSGITALRQSKLNNAAGMV